MQIAWDYEGASAHRIGGLAQLARAPALQAGGQRFESVILHSDREAIESLCESSDL